MSRPTRARGLKHADRRRSRLEAEVAPHAGAWIETVRPTSSIASIGSRAPRGRVD